MHIVLLQIGVILIIYYLLSYIKAIPKQISFVLAVLVFGPFIQVQGVGIVFADYVSVLSSLFLILVGLKTGAYLRKNEIKKEQLLFIGFSLFCSALLVYPFYLLLLYYQVPQPAWTIFFGWIIINETALPILIAMLDEFRLGREANKFIIGTAALKDFLLRSFLGIAYKIYDMTNIVGSSVIVGFAWSSVMYGVAFIASLLGVRYMYSFFLRKDDAARLLYVSIGLAFVYSYWGERLGFHQIVGAIAVGTVMYVAVRDQIKEQIKWSIDLFSPFYLFPVFYAINIYSLFSNYTLVIMVAVLLLAVVMRYLQFLFLKKHRGSNSVFEIVTLLLTKGVVGVIMLNEIHTKHIISDDIYFGCMMAVILLTIVPSFFAGQFQKLRTGVHNTI